MGKGDPERKDRNVGRKLARIPCVRKSKKGGWGKGCGTNLVKGSKEAEKVDESLCCSSREQLQNLSIINVLPLSTKDLRHFVYNIHIQLF